MASQIVPTGGNQDLGPATMAIFWTETGIAILIVAARFYARTMIKGVGRDDWFMLATLIIFTAFSCVVTYQASLQGLRGQIYIHPQKISETIKVKYIVEVLCVFSYATAKASVGCLILRLLPPKSRGRKWIIFSVIVLTFIVNSLNCIINFVQCDPPRALWENKIPAHCWDPKVQVGYDIFTSAENVLADFVLALLPISIIWNLNMSLKKRVNLCILLSLSLCAGIAGIVKCTYLTAVSTDSDFTWETYNLTVWSGAEDFIIIVCSSIPTLKPLWDRYIVENKSHHFSRVTMPPASAPKGNGSKGIVVFTDINVNNGPKSLV